MKHIAIVMAAGSGTRLGGDMPKQYRLLNGKPVIYYSLKCIDESFIDEIILVTRHEDISYCEDLIRQFGLKKPVRIIAGGNERYESVYEGLKAIKADEETYVYIQDGARPFLNKEILERSRKDAIKYGASVTAVRSKDTVKITNGEMGVKFTPNRADVYLAQTPQTFKYEIIKSSYDSLFKSIADTKAPEITDDAQVCELYSNVTVHITEGSYSNIKITTSEDFETAEKFLSSGTIFC